MMGEIDHDGAKEHSDSDYDEVELDATLAPPTMHLSEILMDRLWTFEEVLWIRGASTHLSRQELIEAVSDAKEVDEERVDCCFFDEDELSHPTVPTEMLGAAGESRGDVVCIWKTKYEPAPHRKYSRKWKKIKKRMDAMPARWYMITAIRKDGLLDDEAKAATMSAEYVSPEELAERNKPPVTEEDTMWLPPAFDERGKVKPLY